MSNYVSLAVAARHAGISTEAMRKRIKRNKVEAKKNASGNWLVRLDKHPDKQDKSPPTVQGQPSTHHTDLIQLQQQVIEEQKETIRQLLSQQQQLIQQNENEQVLRRTAQDQLIALTGRMADMSAQTVPMLLDRQKLRVAEEERATLKTAVMQLISYISKKKSS